MHDMPPLPCDREESEETLLLRTKVSEYIHLLDVCEHGVMDSEDAEALDRLYAELMQLEESHWSDGFPTSQAAVVRIQGYFDDVYGVDFPMIYFNLGLLEDFNQPRSFE